MTRVCYSAAKAPAASSLRSAAGFTLLEIIIVVAMIGLMSAVVVGGATSLLREGPVTLEDSLGNAMASARRLAVTEMAEVRLEFDSTRRQFHCSWPGGSQDIDPEIEGSIQVDFLDRNSDSAMLLGGTVVGTDTLPFVSFYADGTCSAFRAQLRSGGPARVVDYDPWTCAPMAKELRR